MPRNLHVGNLSFGTTSDDLRTLFAQYGEVKDVEVIADRYSGRSRGFGFVEMASDEKAKAAIASLNGYDLDGRRLTVAIAKERTR